MKKVINNPEARQLLENVGQTLDLDEETKLNMKKFITSILYGESGSCAQARAAKWQKLEKKKAQ